MRTHLLATIFSTLLIISCSKEKDNAIETLNRKWQVYSIKIVKLDDGSNQGACNYQTQVSDMYGSPTTSSCQDDDIYDFTDHNKLTIYSGSKKCLPSQPNSTIKSYEQKGDSLFIDGMPHHIVSLSRDTLILDYCTDVNTYPPGTIVLNRAKVGMKFIGVK